MKIKGVTEVPGKVQENENGGNLEGTPKVISELQRSQISSGALTRIVNGEFHKLIDSGDDHEHNYDTDGPGHLHEHNDSAKIDTGNGAPSAS